MSHFAEIDKNNKVLRICVGDDNLPNEGYDWFVENLGGTWVKTSYNTRMGKHMTGGEPFRLNYAAVGWFYNEEVDGFVPPQPFPSWVVNPETGMWESPIPQPESDLEAGLIYAWDENQLNWVLEETD